MKHPKKKLSISEKIENPGIIPVFRNISKEKLFPLIDALIAGGISCIELTMTIPDAINLLRICRDRYDGKITIGMGTVIEKEQARVAIEAGAEFLVSPVLSFDALNEAKKFNIPFIMGAFSPTEIYRANQSGADYVKIFPLNVPGIRYIKDILGPMPGIKIIPTGGIKLNQVQELLRAGVSAMGIGSDLVSEKLIEQENWQAITDHALLFLKEVEQFKTTVRTG
jgi:2-dehydro-3-deoxyphosphogluconate aldolase/(4S)-4-hydroxy-2-oxoglutarate aldolase